MAIKSCGLRDYTPGGRSKASGFLSGLKNDSPDTWKKINDSVYVGRMIPNVENCESCQEKCQQDSKCKINIFSHGQCSLDYGDGPYTVLPLKNAQAFSSFRCPGINFISLLWRGGGVI